MNEKWDRRFLELARVVSTWSKDPGLQVGAVIVDHHRKVVSLGYNGFPRDIEDDITVDRETKLDLTIHAEMNAILAATQSLHNCTMYIHPIPPCHRCAVHIIQSGIGRIVSYHLPLEWDRWQGSIDKSIQYFDEALVSTCIYPRLEDEGNENIPKWSDQE